MLLFLSKSRALCNTFTSLSQISILTLQLFHLILLKKSIISVPNFQCNDFILFYFWTDDEANWSKEGRWLRVSLQDYGETTANRGHDPSRKSLGFGHNRGRNGRSWLHNYSKYSYSFLCLITYLSFSCIWEEYMRENKVIKFLCSILIK